MRVMFRILCLALTLSIFTGCVHNSSVQKGFNEGNARINQDFNLGWSFIRDVNDDDLPPDAAATWKLVDLPHDYSIESPFVPPANSTGSNKKRDVGALGLHMGSRSTGYLPGGLAWYKKEFSLPEAYSGKKIQILFDGVYMYSDVWLNGNHLGHHHYGYTAFAYDLTPHLNEKGKNILFVRVNNKLESRWYPGSGIYRPVKLVVSDHMHIPIWGTYVTTPQVTSDKADILVETTISNDSKQEQEVKLFTRILDANGNEVAQTESSQTISPDKIVLVKQDLQVNQPELWSLELPNLYKTVSEVIVNNTIVDDLITNFGIRTLKFDSKEGFTLNGKYTKLKGVCIHHDNGILGAESYAWAEERKVLKLKEMGCNAIRCAHNPPSTTFLDACDKHGMLVINEAFDEWKRPKANGYAPFLDKWWKTDLSSMVLRDRNHPSIIMWSIGNEIPEQGYPEGPETAKMLADYVRKLDLTRPTTHAIQPGHATWGDRFPPPEYFAAVDVCGYNYESISRDRHKQGFATSHKEFPNRIMYQSEAQMPMFFKDWMLITDNRHILGDFVWTGIDYLGEVGCGREKEDQASFPAYIAMCGDLDICLNRKPRSYYRQLLWSGEKTVFATVQKPEEYDCKKTWWGWQPSISTWTWDVEQGKKMQVDVYSGCEEAELFLNGQSLGKKETSRNTEFIASWEVPYEKGVLKVVGYENGKLIAKHTLKSATDAQAIKLHADRQTIDANGCDICYINVELVGKNRIYNPMDDHEVVFEIGGPATIAAVGTGNPYAPIDYPFHGNKCKTYEGRATLILRSTTTSGDIKVKALCQGLNDGIVTLKAQ